MGAWLCEKSIADAVMPTFIKTLNSKYSGRGEGEIQRGRGRNEEREFGWATRPLEAAERSNDTCYWLSSQLRIKY
jgi:hypothetical protein